MTRNGPPQSKQVIELGNFTGQHLDATCSAKRGTLAATLWQLCLEITRKKKSCKMRNFRADARAQDIDRKIPNLLPRFPLEASREKIYFLQPGHFSFFSWQSRSAEENAGLKPKNHCWCLAGLSMSCRLYMNMIIKWWWLSCQWHWHNFVEIMNSKRFHALPVWNVEFFINSWVLPTVTSPNGAR